MTRVRCVVFGDDFTFMGQDSELRKIRLAMKEWFEVRDRGIMGSGTDDIKEIVILGRKLRYREWGLEYEADQKHRQILMSSFGFDSRSNGVRNLVQDKVDEGEDEIELSRANAKQVRALAARLNYIVADRMDVQYATKGVCKWMARPTIGAMSRLKRVVRYLTQAERMVWEMRATEEDNIWIDAISDSDWAGDRASRKSTSGGILAVAGVALKSWSVSQKSIATSSAEAEYHALTKVVADGIGLQSMAADLGWSMRLRVCTDSSGAEAIASRKGLGKTRHIEVRYLWVQDLVRDGKVIVRKVDGFDNPADTLTKALAWEDMGDKCARVGGMLKVI